MADATSWLSQHPSLLLQRWLPTRLRLGGRKLHFPELPAAGTAAWGLASGGHTGRLPRWQKDGLSFRTLLEERWQRPLGCSPGAPGETPRSRQSEAQRLPGQAVRTSAHPRVPQGGRGTCSWGLTGCLALRPSRCWDLLKFPRRVPFCLSWLEGILLSQGNLINILWGLLVCSDQHTLERIFLVIAIQL